MNRFVEWMGTVNTGIFAIIAICAVCAAFIIHDLAGDQVIFKWKKKKGL